MTVRWGLKEAWSKDAGKRTCDFIGTFESSGALGHKELDRYLARQNACSRLEIEAGWYTVLRVPAVRSDEDLTLELLISGSVYVHPGHFYDFPTDGFLVVSLITPEAIFSRGITAVFKLLG